MRAARILPYALASLVVLSSCSSDNDGDGDGSCTITNNSDGTSTLSCPDGSSTVFPGMQADAGAVCGITKTDAGSLIRCSDGSQVLVPTPPRLMADAGKIAGVTERHGLELLAQRNLAINGKFIANAVITSASADADGKVTVDFEVKTPAGQPVNTVTAITANIAKLTPPPAGEASSRWVPYIWRVQTVANSDGGFPNPDGTASAQANREGNGQLTNNGDGTYSYTFANSLSNVTVPNGGPQVPYERNRTHRVSIMMGGSTGPTASAHLDFVPDGSAVTETRNLVETGICQECHGPNFAAHGGDRVTVENCTTCHEPMTLDPQSGNTVDLKVMIHKIHAGRELASIPGPDGIVFDNPATTADESADNGEYAIYGFGESKHTWFHAAFPAVIENCTKCHTGSGQQVDNWKTNPSRAACGSCHDTVDFATGTNHPAGPQANDDGCSICHMATATPAPGIAPIIESHEFLRDDQRDIPEFTIGLTVSTPANGQFFVNGEQPKVTLVINENGAPIDHTTVFQEASSAAEGCPEDAGPCPPRDGLFTQPILFIHGPRARRNPVLGMAARAEVIAPASGPFDLSATGASLSLLVDNGEDIRVVQPNGVDVQTRSAITVAVPASGAFADKAAATEAEIIAWLNKDSAFKGRAIAYLDEQTGRLAIRSRNLGQFFAVQLQPSVVTTAVFGGDVTVKVSGTGFYPQNIIARQADAGSNDPKAAWFTDRIEYTLDPVDDLKPGTYVASVEIGDRGRKSNTDYKTPSVAITPFQVKQAEEELPPARSCNSCHQNHAGEGLVLDPARHNKILSDMAIDQCGACHDYQNRDATGAWAGAAAITKRVHAIHNGANLNFPLTTVGYSGGDPVAGRNWHIVLPRDVRECEACHPAGTSSGSWKNKAARLPCSGCHDSNAAQAHMNVNTFDPTPAGPFSGDEQESCTTCH